MFCEKCRDASLNSNAPYRRLFVAFSQRRVKKAPSIRFCQKRRVKKAPSSDKILQICKRKQMIPSPSRFQFSNREFVLRFFSLEFELSLIPSLGIFLFLIFFACLDQRHHR